MKTKISWTLVVLMVLGLTGPAIGSEGETTRPEFGLLIVSFLFLMGVSQAGVVFCAVHRLARAQWSKPYYRLAELSTMAFFPFAIVGILLIYFLGKNELFYWLSASPEEHLSPWLNGDWLLIRNLVALFFFYGLSAVYVWKSLKVDLDRESNVNNSDPDKVEVLLYRLSPWILISFVICNTLLAWDFAMMLIPHWHSTVFPIHYWFGNAYAGTAALIVFPALLSRFSNAPSHFGPGQIRNLSMVVSGFMLLWLYFYWAQFFVMWFGNLPRETDALFRQMYGHYAPYYWTMMAGCFFVPFVCLIFAIINRSLVAMCVLALGINMGVWINRYLMVMPVFSPDDRILDHPLDFSLSIGLLISFVVVVVLLARRFPVYSSWEIERNRADADTSEASPDSIGSSP